GLAAAAARLAGLRGFPDPSQIEVIFSCSPAPGGEKKSGPQRFDPPRPVLLRSPGSAPAPGVLDDRFPPQLGDNLLGLAAEDFGRQLIADLFLYSFVKGALSLVLALHQADDVEAIGHLHDRTDAALGHPEQERLDLGRLNLPAFVADAGPVAQRTVAVVVLLAQDDEIGAGLGPGGELLGERVGRHS